MDANDPPATKVEQYSRFVDVLLTDKEPGEPLEVEFEDDEIMAAVAAILATHGFHPIKHETKRRLTVTRPNPSPGAP